MAYLTRLQSLMNNVSRGVLRSEICASLKEVFVAMVFGAVSELTL